MMSNVLQMADTYKLLGDKSRLTILALLQEKPLCVCDIVDFLEMSQPNISQHMRKLKSGGLVMEEKRGQWVYYSLDIEDKPYVLEAIRHVPVSEIEKLKMKKTTNCEC